jgi:ActR/RegA family two-component response regulator
MQEPNEDDLKKNRPRAGDRITWRELSRAHIRATLEDTYGCIKEAAAILGLHRFSLSRKIRRERIGYVKLPRSASKKRQEG